MISNPTSSFILLATGRSDAPTLDSADFVLPPGSVVQLVVNGADFAATYLTPGGLPDVGNTSQISIFDKSEPISAIGSLPIGVAANATAISVTVNGVTLTASVGNMIAGATTLTLSWSGYAGAHVDDYVAVLPRGAAIGGWLDYWRLNSGTHTSGASPAPSGSFVVTTPPLSAGLYEWQIEDTALNVPVLTLNFSVT